MFLDVRDVDRIKDVFSVGAVGVGDTRRRTLGNGFLEHSESRIMQGFHRMYYY